MPFSPGVLFLAQRSVTLEHVKWLLFPEMREAERKRERRRVGGGGGGGGGGRGDVEKKSSFYSQKMLAVLPMVEKLTSLSGPTPLYCFQVEPGLKQG